MKDEVGRGERGEGRVQLFFLLGYPSCKEGRYKA